MSTMSTTTLDHPALRVTQGRVMRSEWTKLRSLRSTPITLLVAMVMTIGFSALTSAVTANRWTSNDFRDRAGFNAVTTSLNGVHLSQLAVGVLGVLLFSGEYATGMIRATLTAVPKRLPVLWAKLGVFTVVLLVISLVSTFVSFFLGQSLLSSAHIDVSLSASHALRMVVGAALYLTLVGLTGLALGALLRNTAAGISTLVGLLFVIPPLLETLPTNWQDTIGPYLPSNAGGAIWASPDSKHLGAWTGLGVMALWAVAAIIAAAVGLRRRDA